MGKMTRYFLLTDSINTIDLYVADIEMYFHPLLIFHFDQSNILKNILYIEKSAIS